MAYPYPYYGPAYQPSPPKAKTPNGLKWCIVAFVIYLAFLGVSVGFALYAATALSAAVTDPLALLGVVAVVLLFGIALFGTGISALVLYFIGFGTLYTGRNEFGPAHARNLRLSLILLICAVIAGGVGTLAAYILSSGAVRFDFFTGTATVNEAAFYQSALVGISTGIVVAALVAAILVLSVRELARAKHQTLLYAAAGLGTATPGVAGALTLLQLPRFLQTLEEFFARQQPPFGTAPGVPLDPSYGIPALVSGALTVVTFLLYLLVYRDARTRIDAGDLKPTLPPAPPPTPWMPAPAYPAYPAYPTPPPHQPPSPPQPPPAGP